MHYRFIAEQYKDTVAGLKLNEPADWMQYSDTMIVRDRTTETHRLRPPTPLPACYAKIYRYPKWTDRFKILFRGGWLGRCRAKVEFDHLRSLSARGLAPKVIAYGDDYIRGLLHQSLLVTEEVSGAVPLDTFIAENLNLLRRAERLMFIRTLATFTKTMHIDGFINGKYHWRNILVRATEGAFVFQVIDPSSSRQRYQWRWPFYDISTLDICAPFYFSRTDRLRFVKAYWGCPNVSLTLWQKRRIEKIASLRDRIAKTEWKRYKHIVRQNRTPDPKSAR